MKRRTDEHRLFLALWPDAQVRARIASRVERQFGEPSRASRRVGAHRYHLTLHFLGNFERYPNSPIKAASAAAGEVRGDAFVLSLDRFGRFGKRIGWLGCRSPPAPLLSLHQALAGRLQAHGLTAQPSAADFTPHVTVVRGNSGAAEQGGIPAIPWRVDAFVLVHSRLGARAEYTIVQRFALASG